MLSKEEYTSRIDSIITKDDRYQREAYNFMVMAINYTLTVVVRKESVSAVELLDGIKIYGLIKFGPMTKAVFSHWGIYQCSDFGEIMIHLISKGVILGPLNKVIDEFQEEVFDFTEAFEKPYKSEYND